MCIINFSGCGLMGKYVINGGNRLCGEITARGAKNAALPLFSAALLAQGEVVLRNCPRISDVYYMCGILERIGCKVNFSGNTAYIDSSGASNYVMPCDISRKIRSSIFMLGSMLARFKKAQFTYPGGCEIGQRPIDIHLQALEQLGVEILEQNDSILCNCTELRGGVIKLSYPSVGATENTILAACMAKGSTIIENAAREPEIVDLQNMLNAMGADISGAGSSDIYINGVSALHGVDYACMPDRIETGTYLCMAAATKGDITVKGVVPEHVKSVTDILKGAGAHVKIYKDSIRVWAENRLRALGEIVTQPYPGFPTDMQAQICAVAATCKGVTKITENVFENRMKHLAEFAKMGVGVSIDGQSAYITGIEKLMAAQLVAADLRGGSSLVIAALAANGVSYIYNTALIDRGYEDFEHTIASLGADIRKLGE